MEKKVLTSEEIKEIMIASQDTLPSEKIELMGVKNNQELKDIIKKIYDRQTVLAMKFYLNKDNGFSTSSDR